MLPAYKPDRFLGIPEDEGRLCFYCVMAEIDGSQTYDVIGVIGIGFFLAFYNLKLVMPELFSDVYSNSSDYLWDVDLTRDALWLTVEWEIG